MTLASSSPHLQSHDSNALGSLLTPETCAMVRSLLLPIGFLLSRSLLVFCGIHPERLPAEIFYLFLLLARGSPCQTRACWRQADGPAVILALSLCMWRPLSVLLLSRALVTFD